MAGLVVFLVVGAFVSGCACGGIVGYRATVENESVAAVSAGSGADDVRQFVLQRRMNALSNIVYLCGIGAHAALSCADAATGTVFGLVLLLAICIASAIVPLGCLGSTLSAYDAELKKASPECTLENFRLGEGRKYKLTPHEYDILALLMNGRSVGAAADGLCIAESTVKSHIKNIYAKMDVHSRKELLARIRDESSQAR